MKCPFIEDKEVIDSNGRATFLKIELTTIDYCCSFNKGEGCSEKSTCEIYGKLSKVLKVPQKEDV